MGKDGKKMLYFLNILKKQVKNTLKKNCLFYSGLTSEKHKPRVFCFILWVKPKNT